MGVKMIIQHHFNPDEKIILMKIDAFLEILLKYTQSEENRTDLRETLKEFRKITGD